MPAGEPTLEDLRAEFAPVWRFWRGVNNLCYAEKVNASPPVVLRGEDPLDLRDVINGWIGRDES